jgi:molybdopterin converting factor small subunit
VNVKVRCFGAMRDYLADGSGEGQVEVPDGSKVGDVVDALAAPRGLVFAVLVDGLQADLERELHDRAEVTLMPPFAGGRDRSEV